MAVPSAHCSPYLRACAKHKLHACGELLSRQGHADAEFGPHGPGPYGPRELKYCNAASSGCAEHPCAEMMLDLG